MGGRVKYFGNIVVDGLILDLDAGKRGSYLGTGTTWTDISGNGFNGTLINGPSFNSSNAGSIVFDGTNDYVAIGSSSPVTTAVTNISLEVWFNATSLSTNNRIFYNGNSGTNGYGLYFGACGAATTTLSVLFGGAYCYVVQKTNMATGQWYHAVFTRISIPSISNTLYINGQSVSTNTTWTPSTPGLQNSVGTTIGGLSTEEYFNGKISVARIYNKTLSAIEVSQNYNALKGRYGL